jgi:hypothetical protein
LSVEVHLEKGRDLYGSKAKPFAVQLATSENGQEWLTRDLEASRYETACSLFESGGKATDAMDELALPRSTAFKFQQRWREQSQVSSSIVRDSETAEADQK